MVKASIKIEIPEVDPEAYEWFVGRFKVALAQVGVDNFEMTAGGVE